MENSKICIIRNDKIGDVLLTCPMMHTIKENWPSAHITVILMNLLILLLSVFRPLMRLLLIIDNNLEYQI